MNNDIQQNTNDCGVYAIAFAVSLAFLKGPACICIMMVTPSEMPP